LQNLPITQIKQYPCRSTIEGHSSSAKEGNDMSKQSDLLEAVSVADRVGELQFTVGQVCRMAGITKMQLDYWTERGTIPTHGKKQRLYDASAVETVMLIKQARDLGFDVNAAIAASKDFQARQSAAAGRSRQRLAA
jgi:MerR-like DNA binding protein